jgi:hypothetical protein
MMNEFIIRRAEQFVAREISETAFVNQTLRMLNAETDGKRFRSGGAGW